MLKAFYKNAEVKEAKAQVLLKAVRGVKCKKKGFFWKMAAKKQL